MKRRTVLFSVILVFGLGLTWALLWSLGDGLQLAQAQGPDTYSVYYVAVGGACGGAVPCYSSVQAAVDAVDDPVAEIGAVVKVAAGIYSGVEGRPVPDGYKYPPASGTITQVVYLSKTLTLRGGYSTADWSLSDPESNHTTLDAAGQGRVLFITWDISPTIEGLHLTGGSADGLGGWSVPFDVDSGAGVYVDRSSGTLRGNVISGNGTDVISTGGGLFVWQSDVLVSDNVIRDNVAYHGGGLYVAQDAATFSGNRVYSNTAGTGGGWFLNASHATLINNVVTDNRSDLWGSGDGSGMFVAGSSPQMLHTTIARNLAGDGCGVCVTNWGGLYSSPSLTNTILSGQEVGIYVRAGSTASLESTLWHDNGTDWDGPVTRSNDLTGDPAFVDADAGDYHLSYTSAALDGGVDAGVAVDVDGETRPSGAGYDLGADEWMAPPQYSQDVRVTASSDDAEERSTGWVALTGDSLTLVDMGGGSYQTVGLRFDGLEITPGMEIVNGYVQFEADATTFGETELTIEGHANDDAPTFEAGWNPFSTRPKTSSSVFWSPLPWTTGFAGPEQRTPDLSTVIQEIVDRIGWSPGNALALFFSGIGRRVAESYDGDPPAAPLLHVEFRVPPRTCWARVNDDPTDYDSVQAAVDAAVEGDLVKVAGTCRGVSGRLAPPGYPNPPASGVIRQVVAISKTISLQGGYTIANWTTPDSAAHPTTLDAKGQGRVLCITGNVSPTVSGLRLTNGDAYGLGGLEWIDVGGGVYVHGGAPLIHGNQVLSGSAYRGGGLYLFQSAATVQDNTFVLNSAVEGGGLAVDESDAAFGGAAIIGNTIVSNTADFVGGGAMLSGDGIVLDGTTIAGNNAPSGGALYLHGGSIALTDNLVKGNAADSGGGVTLQSGDALLHGNTIVSNTATFDGGGIDNSGTMTLTHGTVSGNAAEQGGGIQNSGVMTLIDSTVDGNTGIPAGGGGILNFDRLTLIRSTVSRNQSTDGGGILSGSGVLILTNSTVSYNDGGTGSGGGIAAGGAVTLTNSTVTQNQTTSTSGGIAVGGTVALINSIVAEQFGGNDCSGPVVSLGHNLDSDGTCGLTASGDISNTAPLLSPLQDNGGPTETHALLEGSPATDAGDDAACPATDQRGIPRPQDGDGDGTPTCDVGAFEAVPSPSVIPVTTSAPEVSLGDGECSLKEAIGEAQYPGSASASGDCPPGSLGEDVIDLQAPGPYVLAVVDNDTTGPNGLPAISSPITVVGHGAAIERSSADGTPEFRLWYVADAGDLTLDQVTVRRGFTTHVDGCGGILNRGVLTLIDSIVSDNTADWLGGTGGGICNLQGTATLTGSTISDNFGYNGEGGLLNDGGTLTLDHCVVSGNGSQGTGGIHNYSGTVTVENSLISDNDSGFATGGIWNGDTLIVVDSTIRGNRGGYIGGIGNGGTATLTGSTVSGNRGWGDRGGITNSGDMTVTNCTIGGNEANDGGGIWNKGTLTLINSTVSGNRATAVNGCGGLCNDTAGVVTLQNNIVGGQLAGADCAGIAVTSLGHNLDSDGTCGLAAPGDISGADPLLGPLQDYGGPTETYLPLPGSPVIDAGNAAGCPPADQRGVTRPQDGNAAGAPVCDIGAVERLAAVQETQPIEPGDAPPVDFATVGVTVDCSEGPGGTLVVTRHEERYHSPPPGVGTMLGNWDLQAYFSPYLCDLTFHYDEADLNGAAEGDIAGAARSNGGHTLWSYLGGVLDTDADTITIPGVHGFSSWVILTSTPPEAVPYLAGSRSGSDLVLDWPAVTEDIQGNPLTPDHYVVYRRANEIYFQPQAGDIVATPASPGFTDAGALGDPANNYYYMVTAVDGAGLESAGVRRLGAFNYALVPAAAPGERAYNLIALPLEGSPAGDADSLATYAGPGVYMVLRHDAPAQAMEWRLPGLAGTNFGLGTPDPVFLYLDETAADWISVIGYVSPVGALGFDLARPGPGGSCTYNFVSVPLYRDDLFDADGLAADIGGVYSVSRYNAETQDLTWRIPGVSGENFPVRAGYPYIVCLDETAPARWP